MTTQFARASYQEIVDLHTESDTVSVIGIHTPQGDTPRKMFGGFFEQFKKFKYLGCSIKLVPAARLPADPLQVSYDAGETTIDPRDMLNPLMFHGCHGNDMGVILNRLYSLNSIDGRKSDSIVMEQDDVEWTLEGILSGDVPNFQLEDLYYKALTDNTWKKAHPQRGFRKSGLRPLVYKMATNLQMLGAGDSLVGLDGLGIPQNLDVTDDVFRLRAGQSGRQFFTPGLTGLGWLDTRNVLTRTVAVDYDGSDYDDLDDAIPALESAIRDATLRQQDESESSLPLVYMGMILLPPAYKTEQYFRMVINHHFAFKDFRGISFSNNLAVTPAYDNFNADDDGESVDPPTPGPDPEPTPDPDPPVGAAYILKDNYSRGNQVTGLGTVDRYSTLEASNQDYEVVVTATAPANYQRITSKTFAILQEDSEGGDINIGVFLYTSNNTSDAFLFGPDYSGYSTLVYLNGKYLAYKIGGSWVEKTASDVGVTVTVSPANTDISDKLGTTTAFEGVSVDLP